MGFEKCKRPCKYRSGTPDLNGCDYLYLTGKKRDCPAGGACTKFEAGDRIRDRTNATQIAEPEKRSVQEHIARDYFRNQKRRMSILRDSGRKY